MSRCRFDNCGAGFQPARAAWKAAPQANHPLECALNPQEKFPISFQLRPRLSALGGEVQERLSIPPCADDDVRLGRVRPAGDARSERGSSLHAESFGIQWIKERLGAPLEAGR